MLAVFNAMVSSPSLTLKEVAKRLGVSTATVSNAFNRPSQLSAKLRQDILTQCAAFDYYGPGASSRVMRTEKTGIVGLMVSNYLTYSFADPIACQFLQGVAEIFEPKNYNMLICPSRENLPQLRGGESFVDGFIVYGPPHRGKLAELTRQNKAFVTVDYQTAAAGSVNIDNENAAFIIAQHALRHAPKRVAIIGLRITEDNHLHTLQSQQVEYDPSNITSQRLRGYLNACRECGVSVDADDIINVPDNTHDFGLSAAHHLLGREHRPDLILCMSDRLGLAALNVAQAKGLLVPQDLQITGFDDISEAGLASPGLTTIRQNSIEKGHLAAKLFLGLHNERHNILSSELVVRDSCPLLI